MFCAGLVASIAAAIAILPSPARAQDDPIVVGQRERPEPFGFQFREGFLEILFRYQFDQVKPNTGQKTSTTENVLRESLRLSADAYVIHPNLLDLKLSGAGGASEDWIENQDGNAGTVSPFYEYDVSGTFLRREMAPLTLYSRRTEELVSRQFGGTLTSTMSEYGASMDIRSKTLPSRWHLYHVDQIQKDSEGVDDTRVSQDVFEWHSESRLDTGQFFGFDYRFNSVAQQTGSGASFDTHEASAHHSLEFGPEHRYTLTSMLSYFTQSGASALDRVRWDQDLMLRHTKAFETFYHYSLDAETRADFDQTLQRGSAGFRHRLYDSLITTGNVGLLRLDQSPSGGSTEMFGNLNLDYTKRVPYGLLGAGLAVSYSQQDNESRSTDILVLDEPHVFTDPLPVTLNRRNIVASSLVVTPQDPRDGNDPLAGDYALGADYTVTTFPDRVEIRRVIGGRIDNGQAVLIDYRLGPEGANTTQTLGTGVSLRYDIQEGPLAGLAGYFRYFRQDQSVSSDTTAVFVPDKIDDTTFGAEYRVWKLIFNGEYQIHDSTTNPYNATRAGGRYLDRLARDTLLGINLQYTSLDYTTENNRVVLLTASTELQQRFSQTLHGRLMVTWRSEQDGLRGNTEGFEQQAELNWRYRETEVFIQARNAILNTDAQDNLSAFVQVGIRRHF